MISHSSIVCKIKDQGTDCVASEDPLPGISMAFSYGLTWRKRQGSFISLFYKDTDPIHGSSTLMT